MLVASGDLKRDDCGGADGMIQMIFEGKTQGSTIRNKDWMERNPSVFCDEWKPTEKDKKNQKSVATLRGSYGNS